MIDPGKTLRVLESASTFVFFTSSFQSAAEFRQARVEFSNGGLGVAGGGSLRGQTAEAFLASIFKSEDQLTYFLDQLQSRGSVPEFEVAVKEGFFSVNWCQVSAKIIPLDEGECYMQGFFVGLNRVKEVERSLNEENKVLETILGGIGDAVLVYGGQGNIIFQSPLHEKWFHDPHPHMFFRQRNGHDLNNAQPVTRHESRHDSDGNPLSLDITSYPIKNAAGEFFAGIEVVQKRTQPVAALSHENGYNRPAPSNHAGGVNILGQSQAIKDVIFAMEKISQLDTVVFIQGDTGTGKELVARGIQALSRRRNRPFVTINCGALTETLLDSELFGHKKGAFTGASTEKTGLFEAADGGTIFLDEIGEMSMGTQVKLLRVLQDGEVRKLGSTVSKKVNVRVITATHRNIQKLVAEKKFREDLFYRIHVFTIHTPPLASRGEDILLLARHFLAEFARQQGKPVHHISDEAAKVLLAHPWPGNVRELQNAIERATILCDSGTLQVGDLPHSLFINSQETRDPSFSLSIENETLDDVFRKKILASLKKNRWNKTLTAKDLNISRATLWRKIKDLSIQAD